MSEKEWIEKPEYWRTCFICNAKDGRGLYDLAPKAWFCDLICKDCFEKKQTEARVVELEQKLVATQRQRSYWKRRASGDSHEIAKKKAGIDD